MMLLPSSILFISLIQEVVAYPHFADEIPNGGGGPLNPFGEDFRSNQFTWTVELCQADSDGDGRTNGAELGDPNCVWFAGGPEPEFPALSHPGIVDEPLDAPALHSCSDYEEPNQVIEYDIGFSTPTFIDETRTHYICEQRQVAVPSSEVLHKIKTSVLLDNQEVLHHMFVFFCFDDSLDGNRVGEGPYECSGNESRCVRVAGWAVGPEETCLPSHIGEEYDFTDMDNVVVKIEAHYDNASGKSQQDQSGIRLTMTPELRPLTSASTILGMFTPDKNFELPPQNEAYPLLNVCPGEATSNLPHPIYVYSFAPHMHLFGHTLYTEHFRCGEKIGEIGRIDAYEFDNQQSYRLPEPVKVLPGDTLITTCKYNTMPSNVTLVGGEETTDEMCLNFLHYYPAVETTTFRACTSFENGIDAGRLMGSTQLDALESSPQLGALRNLPFAVGPGDGLDSLILNYEVDPSKNVAECCETNSCEEAYLEVVGGKCALDRDCMGDLACSGGFCVEVPIGGDDSGATGEPSEDENAGMDQESSGGYLGVVIALVGIVANVLV